MTLTDPNLNIITDYLSSSLEDYASFFCKSNYTLYIVTDKAFLQCYSIFSAVL